MNILFHGHEFPPNGGGVGTYMMNMAIALSMKGQNVFVVTGKHGNLPEEEDVCGVKVFRKYSRDDIGSSRLVNYLLDFSDKYCIDWIEGADYGGDCAQLLKSKNRPPIVIKIHTCNVLAVALKSHVFYSIQWVFVALSLLRQWRQYRDERFCLQNADVLFAPSERVVSELRKQNLKLPDSIPIVPNPLMLKGKNRLGEAPYPTLLFVGRIDIGKGIEFLPKIMKELKGTGAKLWIAGSDSYAKGLGSLKAWLHKQFVKEGCLSDVQFLGRLDFEELNECYERAWVVVLPTRWDNFPTVVLEAMNSSKPVVTTPYGGMSEMLSETLCTIAAPNSSSFSEAIKELLEDQELRRKTGLSMRAKLEAKYSPVEIADRYLHVIRGALNK